MYRSINEVINDSNNSRSSSDNQSVSEDESSMEKRRPRRVRTLIKASIEEVVNKQTLEQYHSKTKTKKNTSNVSFDKQPFPFGQCRVCMDKATGAHYGVPTCEGCKGFFKRSILRKEKYRCYFGDGCVINTDNRNRCKSCRFQKCLKEGMSVEGVRMGRIPKLVKEKALAEHHLSSSSIENEDPGSFMASSLSPSTSSIDFNAHHLTFIGFDLELIDEQELLDEFDSVLFDNSPAPLPLSTIQILPDNFPIDDHQSPLNRSFLANCTVNYDEYFSTNVLERIKNLVAQLSQLTASVELGYVNSGFIRYLRYKMIDLCRTYNGCTKQLIERMNTLISLGTNDFPGDWSSLQDIWAGLTDAIPYHVKNLITFAREMPGINEIGADDFNQIMNNRLFDFWLIKHAPLIRHNESYIMLPNGLQYTHKWMNKIIGEEMVEAMFAFAKQFNALNLTEEEYALVFPVVICMNDITLNDQETVHHIQHCYLYALYTQMSTTRTQIEAKTVFRSFLQVFALLPLLNDLQKKKIGSLTPDLTNLES